MTRPWNPFDDAQPTDPVEAGRNLARFVAGYFAGLIESGVPEDKAMGMTLHWMGLLVKQGKQ